jgi:hypothetical protein
LHLKEVVNALPHNFVEKTEIKMNINKITRND